MGTDGLWSSPSMNLFEETLAALKLHGFEGATGLELATLGGARALGIEAESGSLKAGKWADLAVVDAARELPPPGGSARAPPARRTPRGGGAGCPAGGRRGLGGAQARGPAGAWGGGAATP